MSKKTIIFSIAFCFLFLIFHSVAGNILQMEALTTNTFSPVLEKVEINPVSLTTDNYFVMMVSVVGGSAEISSASAIIKSPSQKDTVNILLRKQGQNWNSSFTIPSSFENGQWSVWEITLRDRYLRTKKYSKDEINVTFLFGKEESLDSSNEEVLNEQRKQECIQSNGLWNQETNTCSCPTNYELQDSGSCLYVPPCTFEYSTWSQCQTDGTQTRTVISSSNCSTTDNPILTQTCTYSAKECTFEYSTWSQCQTDGTQTRTVISSSNCSTTDNPVLTQACNYLDRTCTFEYSTWSQCQTDGTQTRTVISSSNCSTTDNPVLTQACVYIPSPEELFRKKVEELNTVQKLINYLNNNFTFASREGNVAYSPKDFFERKEGGEQDFAAFASYILHENDFISFTFVYEYENNNQKQIKYVTSVRDTDLPKYIYFDNGKVETISHGWSFRDLCRKEEERLGVRILKYGTVSPLSIELSPQEWLTFREEVDLEDEEILIEQCNFNYSSWSQCQPNGTRTRNVLSFFPENCEGGEPKLLEVCNYVKPIIPCIFTYSTWSQCQPNGTQTRNLASKMPANCSEGSPILARSCVYVKPIVSEEKPVVSPVSTISDIISQMPEEALEEKIPEECLRAGISNKEDCNVFTYQLKIVPECLSLGLTNQDQCRNYFLSNYEKPLKCETLSDANCIKLINDVILSTLKKTINEEKKTELVQVSGRKATISLVDSSSVINVDIDGGGKKEIKMENLPISVKENESVSIKLMSIETSESQKGLSPVAISISSEGSELPDDVVARIGQDFNIETLSGVDRAIAEGRSLEQPKFSSFKGESLIVEKVETIEKGSLTVQGKSNPGQIITLFIYSSMPIIVTVQADQDGNWTYSLDKSMVDGTHEVYAVLHNDEGKIIEASTPKTFFVAEAQAISMEEMFLLGDISKIQDDSRSMMTLYLLGGISIIIILIALLLVIKGRTEEL